MTPRVGRFRLLHRLARGGMGEVWLGRDDATGLDAALKWMVELSPQARERFEAEIRAVAAMAHPNLVVVHDVGRSAGTLSLGDRTLPMGSPWFAMELLPNAPLVKVGDWGTVDRVLSSVLRALAHAHARGWVHCDLKPDNVLGDAQGRVVVTDFGVARPLDPFEPVLGAGGTPEFMAPEQLFVQEWRIGPWTDLFAVGILAWVMCTGASPIPRSSVELLRKFHTRPLPRLAAPFPVPSGFPHWVGRLLQPQPAYRFRSAADALAALSNLDGPLEELPARGSWFADIVPAPWGPGRPIPTSWKQDAAVPLGSRSSGRERGLGLVRRRELALVGRQSEQDKLWNELTRVLEGGGPRLVQVTGEGGIGKTALSRWLCARVEELGVARAHRVALGSGEDVPRALLVRVLGRLARAFGETESRGGPSFSEVLSDLGVPDPSAVAAVLQVDRPLSATRGARTVCETLVALSEGRPVVVWLDDADRATSALVQIEALRATSHPVLVIASSREPMLRSAPELDVRLLPLSPPTIHGLLQEVVPLDQGLATWITDRSGGLPLVAMALLGELIDQGGLRWNGVRWAAVGSGALPVPETVRELLEQKVQRVVPDARRWVEIAAVLGTQVDCAVWDEVAAERGLPPRPEDLVNRLVDAGIVSVDPGSVRAGASGRIGFIHALVAEAVAQQTEDRLAIHAVAASRYEARGGTGFEQAAGHWLAAGEVERALNAWYEAVRFWAERDLLVAKEIAIRTASRRDASPAMVARLAARLAAIYRNLGDWHRALDACERGLLRVDAETDPTTAAELYDMRVWISLGLGTPYAEDEARVRALLPRVSDPRVHWKFWIGLSMRTGDRLGEGRAEAIEIFDQALAVAPTDALRDETRTLRAGALAALERFDEAEAELEAVRGRVVTPDDPFHSATWLWLHGVLQCHLGRGPQGLAELKQSLQLRRKLGGIPLSQLLTLATWAARCQDRETASWARDQLGPNGSDLTLGCLLEALVAVLSNDLAKARQHLEKIQLLEPKMGSFVMPVLDIMEGFGHPELVELLTRVRAMGGEL